MEINNQKLYRVEEVVYMLGISYRTLDNWYTFRRRFPEHPISKELPDYIQYGSRGTRYWTDDAVEKLKKMHEIIPKGRTGVMGSVTQQYVKKNQRGDKTCLKN